MIIIPWELKKLPEGNRGKNKSEEYMIIIDLCKFDLIIRNLLKNKKLMRSKKVSLKQNSIT